MDVNLSKITQVREIVLKNYDKYIKSRDNLTRNMIVFDVNIRRSLDADGKEIINEVCIGIKKEFSSGIQKEGWVKYENNSQTQDVPGTGGAIRSIDTKPLEYMSDNDILEYLNSDNFTDNDVVNFWCKIDNILRVSN